MNKEQKDDINYNEIFASKEMKKLLKKREKEYKKEVPREIRKRKYKDLLFTLLILQKQRKEGKINKTNLAFLELFEAIHKKKLDKLDYEKELSRFKKRNKKEEKFENQILKIAEKLS